VQTQKPIVTVAIPSYNHGRYIEEAIKSVLKQGFENFELIIVDDGSSDGTREIISKYDRLDPRIKVHFNERNLGMARNWNRCLELARGRYIKLLHSDDLLFSKQALHKQVDALETYPTAVMTCSARCVIDPQSRVIDTWGPIGKAGLYRGREMIRKCLTTNRNLIGEPTVVLFKRDSAQHGFDERYRQITDLEMWLRLLEHGDLIYLDEPLSAWRNHPLQTTEKNRVHNIGTHEHNDLLVGYLDKQWLIRLRNLPSFFKHMERARKEPEFIEEGVAIAQKLEKILGRLPYRILLRISRFTPKFHRVKSAAGMAERFVTRTATRLFGYMHAARRTLVGQKDLLEPPQKLRSLVGDGDFKEIGEEFFEYFRNLAGLESGHRVLDIGCGCGRMAIPLLEYLKGKGRYYGFDVSKESIDWCRHHLSEKSTRFRFFHSDVKHNLYNPNGAIKPECIKLPFRAGYLDFVFLTSVFTHMLREEMNAYLSQIARVLKPGGRGLATFFLINDSTRRLLHAGKGTFTFKHKHKDYYTDRTDPPEAVVAYEEGYIREAFKEKNLRIIEPVRFGSWRDPDQGLSFQDIVCFEKQMSFSYPPSDTYMHSE
jgi:glycosyltransferase involved in cell wall biosynthesis